MGVSVGFPLVIHRVPRDASEAFVDVVAARERDREILMSKAEYSKRIRFRKDTSPYVVGDPVGKAMDQIGRTAAGGVFANDQDVFEKMSQALNSAHPLLEKAHYAGLSDQRFVYSLVVPMVVVPTGTLWTVDYDEDGNIAAGPHEQHRVTYFVGKDWTVGDPATEYQRNYTLSHVEFVDVCHIAEAINAYRQHPSFTTESAWNRYRDTHMPHPRHSQPPKSP